MEFLNVYLQATLTFTIDQYVPHTYTLTFCSSMCNAVLGFFWFFVPFYKSRALRQAMKWQSWQVGHTRILQNFKLSAQFNPDDSLAWLKLSDRWWTASPNSCEYLTWVFITSLWSSPCDLLTAENVTNTVRSYNMLDKTKIKANMRKDFLSFWNSCSVSTFVFLAWRLNTHIMHTQRHTHTHTLTVWDKPDTTVWMCSI